MFSLLCRPQRLTPNPDSKGEHVSRRDDRAAEQGAASDPTSTLPKISHGQHTAAALATMSHQTAPVVPDAPHSPAHVVRVNTMTVVGNQTTSDTANAQRIRTLLPWHHERNLYTSKWFGALVALLMLQVSALFLTIITLQAVSGTEDDSLFQSGTVELAQAPFKQVM
jgi:hypothetical protein